MIDLNRDITYEFFGIDPSKFYSGKFAGCSSAPDYFVTPANRFNIEYDRARFLAKNVMGYRVLDVGCGSAPYGGVIRNNTGVTEIFGVDLDPVCVEAAKGAYDRVDVFDLNKSLPFEDGYFDCVFSMDVFGHIEFKYKDHLLSEIFRVTKRGGSSVHGIECGIIDYPAADPGNPQCPIRSYVWQEGHVGIEDARSLHSRWERYFSNVYIENAFIWPLKPFASIGNMPMPKELGDIFASFDQSQIDAVQVALGFLQGVCRKYLKDVAPNLLFPNEEHPLSRHSGFVYLTAEKA